MRCGIFLPCSLALATLALVPCSGCIGRSELRDELLADAGADAEPEPDAEVPPRPIETSNKIDLLLVVDNSRNTDAAHTLLAGSLPYLIDRFVHPRCVNGFGHVLEPDPPPGAPCPVGKRDFPPITDLHLAVISTSLGGHGADICSPQSPSFNPSQNDAAHLLSRAAGGGVVPTYESRGFLAWDPDAKKSPVGESDQAALTSKFVDMVGGVGSEGCGFESQLESIYRFLVDPSPYEEITLVDGKATPQGLDNVLLTQRADFLRPDSALAIVLLTDENDCSIRENGQYFFAAQGSMSGSSQPFHLPRARSECASSPDDPCCVSCGQATPSGCPSSEADPACMLPPLSDVEDPINLRCFDQKRRFGIDFLYPVDRYISAFRDPMIPTRDGSLAPNPLFEGNRSPKLVFLAGIVGVPWQDIATDPNAIATGLRPATEIDWDLVLGDPDMGTPPSDPLMIESIAPRTGTHPPTGALLQPPSASTPLANPINGHERLIPLGDDLQYACIYPRSAPKDCSGSACECQGDDIDTNPICQSPANGAYSAVQWAGRALPSIRELELLRALGPQAVVGSVCAAEAKDKAAPTYGYKPAIDALLRSLHWRIE